MPDHEASEFTYITVQYILSAEQLERMQAITDKQNQYYALTGYAPSSLESVFAGMMQAGSKYDIDNKMDFYDKYSDRILHEEQAKVQQESAYSAMEP